MEIPLRILIIEDSEDDALLIVHQLERAGYKMTYERVETKDAMRDAIDRQTWDVIISDYKMPGFSGLAALRLYQEKGLDIPFIVVSGTIGEETAAEAMVSGAHDYVMKDNLSRLIPSIQRELREADSRREHKKTEEALLSSEHKYHALLEHAADAIMIADSEGNFLEINKKAEELLGYTREELMGIKISQVHPGEELERALHAFMGMREGKISSLFDTKVLRKDGKIVPVDITGTTIEYEGKLVIQGIVRDITERKQIEDTLKESESRYRNIFENAIEGIFQTTPEGRYRSVNPSFARMFGFDSPKEMVDTVTDIGRQLYVNPDDRERLKHLLLEHGNVEAFEVELYRKYKSKFWVSINVHAVFGPDGTMLYLEGTNEDITERKQAAEKLRDERQKFAILTENAPFGMAMIDKDGNFVYINKKFKEIFGYDLSDIPDGKTWFKKIYPDPAYRQAVIEAWVKDLKETRPGEPRPRVFTITCKDGTEKIVDFILVQMETGVHIMTCEDITAQKRSEEMLLQSEEKYRSITENTLNGIYQTTKDGKFLMANPAFLNMLGYASFEEMAASINDITRQIYVNPEDREHIKQVLEKEENIRGFETQFYKKDGSKIWVSINMRNVRDAAGTFLYYEGIDEDITHRKLAEQSLQETMEKLRKSLAGTIQVVSMTVETRDPYTAGHQRRVSNLARAIAQEMGLSNNTVDNIRMAGIIHDIGKISVPAEILVKPGKITDIEMSLIKVHPQSGYDILKDVELPYPIAESVLQHHERLDGSGYPQGLKADQILLEARIISVADVAEAIASHRPYRPAKGIDVALEEIENNKGILYDEQVVEVCLKLFREGGFKFE